MPAQAQHAPARARWVAVDDSRQSRGRGTFISGRAVNREDIYVFRFKDPDTGAFVEPMVRMLSVTVASDTGPWHAFLGINRAGRFERLMRVGHEPPAYSEFFIAYEHGAHLIGQPLDPLHGTSIHHLLGERFSAPTVRVERKMAAIYNGPIVIGEDLMTIPLEPPANETAN